MAQKERNTYDHQVQRNQGLPQISECISAYKILFKQNDTKINDFDEDVLILELFFWGNVIFKIGFFRNKSHYWGKEELLWVASPGL